MHPSRGPPAERRRPRSSIPERQDNHASILRTTSSRRGLNSCVGFALCSESEAVDVWLGVRSIDRVRSMTRKPTAELGCGL